MGVTFEFGECTFDPETGELRRGGDSSFMRPQPARLLSLLLAEAGALVSRERIEAELWPAGNPTADEGINACIRQLRSALEDDARAPRFIETVPRRGYRFAAPVRSMPSGIDAHGVAALRRAPSWRLAAAIVLALAAVATLISVVSRGQEDRGFVGLAVLGFDDLDGDAWSQAFATGLTEELTTRLGQLSPQRVHVVASAEAARFDDADRPLYVIGDELGVQYLVTGTVRSDAQRVLITVQLVGVNDQAQRWAHRLEGSRDDPLALQTDTAAAVASAVAELLAAPS